MSKKRYSSGLDTKLEELSQIGKGSNVPESGHADSCVFVMPNAKLLFTNKLFRAFGLSEGDKYRVVETFDRAKNLREVKLVYATLAESFGQKPKIQESKGKSSKPVASTKPKNESKVISEGTDLKNRFKKLANII